MVALIDMPEVAMKHILKKMGYAEIQCLRKTCHTFRNFIDNTNPEQSIDMIELSGTRETITLVIYGKNDRQLYPIGGKIHIEYNHYGKKLTTITWFRKDGYRQKIVGAQNFSDCFFRDFRLILKCKLPILKRFSIYLKGIGRRLRENLYFKNNPIKTHTFSISGVGCQDYILEVLPSVCPDALKRLEINVDNDFEASWIPRMDISKVVELEQWKKANELHIVGYLVFAEIQNFEHFSFANVFFRMMNLNDMLAMKNLFLHTSLTFKYYRINFQELRDRDAFLEEFGPPIKRSNTSYDVQREFLIFKRPEDRLNVVAIGFFPRFFEFRIIKKCDVPNGVEVVN